MRQTGPKIFLQNLGPGWEGEADGLVLSQTLARTNRGGVYLSLELSDRSGRLAAKVWDNAESLAEHLAEGTAVRVRGYLDIYRGTPQLVIREARRLAEAELDWRDFLKAAARPEEEMRAELFGLIEALDDADYRRLTEAALNDPEVADKFFLAPAAKNLHHAYLHGLLEHSLSVGRLAAMTAAHFGGRLEASLLVAGGILHDIGKVWELTLPPRQDYTTPGRLLGHTALGARFIRMKSESLAGFPAEKIDLLEHLILSHHGEPEFGAAVRPQLLEAVALHHLDNLDAKLEAVDSFLDEGTDGAGWSSYHRLFNSHYRRTPALGAAPSPPAEPRLKTELRRGSANRNQTPAAPGESLF